MPCTVVGFLNQTYGKYRDDIKVNGTLIMEYEPFLQYLSQYLPSNSVNSDFLEYLNMNSSALFEYADYMDYTLPKSRYSFY